MANTEYEYKRFGDGFVRRKDPDDEWKFIAQDDMPKAALSEFEGEEAERMYRKQHGIPGVPPQITRGDG